jgi:ATP-dependent exoDNAse (exonuclease V) beta subunit
VEVVTAESEPDVDERAAKAEQSRHGRHFGIAVHRALELVLGAGVDSEEAVAQAIAAASVDLRSEERKALARLESEARSDVRRALAALEAAGLAALDLATEVDLTAPAADTTTLVRGAVDLIAVGSDTVHVLDWKTDAPVAGKLAAAYPAYAEQLRIYGDMIRLSGWLGSRRVRAGLLLTATGEIRWLEE